MIYRPVFLSCDICGIERQPTSGEDRETLAAAFSRARDEGWTVRRNGESIYCSPCMGGPLSDVDVPAGVGVDAETGAVEFSFVPLD